MPLVLASPSPHILTTQNLGHSVPHQEGPSPPSGHGHGHVQISCSAGHSNLVTSTRHIYLQLIALFTILFISTFFAIFPFICRRLNDRHARRRGIADPGGRSGVGGGETMSRGISWKMKIWAEKVTWGAKYFGTGVVLGSAFIHILPAAQMYLTNPCLPEFWTTDYPSMGNALVLIAIVLVFLVDFWTKRWVERGRWVVMSLEVPMMDGPTAGPYLSREGGGMSEDRLETAEEMLRDTQEKIGKGAPHISMSAFDFDLPRSPPRPPRSIPPSRTNSVLSEIPLNMAPTALAFDGPYNRLIQQTNTVMHQELFNLLVLEAGITLHSLLIGVALMLVEEKDFTSLFIAIIFHQAFEGLAIGARLAELRTKSGVPLVACIVYGITTPIGCGIGMAIRKNTDMYSVGGVIAMGVFDALSAGLLIYAGMVGLLAKDFLGDMTRARRRTAGWALGMFGLGLLVMSVLALWA